MTRRDAAKLIPIVSLIVISALLGAMTRQPAAAAGRIVVSGFVDFEPGDRSSIALNDFPVELRSESTTVATARTDPFGRFAFTVEKGTYRVCWSAPGVEAGCSKPFDVLRHRGVPPITVSANGRAVWGSVVFNDGEPAVAIEPLFGIRKFPAVSAGSGKTTANASGEFALFGVADGAESISATFEAAKGYAPIHAGPVTVRLNNTPPDAMTLRSSRAVLPTTVVTAAPGAPLTLRAEAYDADHDALSYAWKGGTLGKVVGNHAAATATAPKTPGRYAAEVLISDGKGGYRVKQITVVVERPASRPSAVTASTPLACSPCTSTPHTVLPCPTEADCANSKFLVRFTNDDTAAKDYYARLDPSGLRNTLSDWYVLAGFNADGSGGDRASYMNDNDLGFGRDMHMITVPGRGEFAYVTNYLLNCGLQDKSNAQCAADATAGTATATVCMEWSTVDYAGPTSPESLPANRIVKFFVYAPAQGTVPTTAADYVLSRAAQLDPNGAKSVPSLCLNCHGGNGPYTTGGNLDLGASFLPFDIDTFCYPDGSGNPCRSPFETPTIDFASLHKLNSHVDNTRVAQTINPDPIHDLISGWYCSTCGDKPDLSFVPSYWQTDPTTQTLYLTTVARSCRTCHVALSPWATFSDFQIYLPNRVNKDVNVAPKQMPHAMITSMNYWSTNFWPDTQQQKVLQCFIANTTRGTTDFVKVKACIEAP